MHQFRVIVSRQTAYKSSFLASPRVVFFVHRPGRGRKARLDGRQFGTVAVARSLRGVFVQNPPKTCRAATRPLPASEYVEDGRQIAEAPRPTVPSGGVSLRHDRWEWSDEVAQMHGYGPGMVIPSTALNRLAHKHPDDRATVADLITTVRRDGSRSESAPHYRYAPDRAPGDRGGRSVVPGRRTRWCLRVLRRHHRAVQHGCAGPADRGGCGDRACAYN